MQWNKKQKTMLANRPASWPNRNDQGQFLGLIQKAIRGDAEARHEIQLTFESFASKIGLGYGAVVMAYQTDRWDKLAQQIMAASYKGVNFRGQHYSNSLLIEGSVYPVELNFNPDAFLLDAWIGKLKADKEVKDEAKNKAKTSKQRGSSSEGGNAAYVKKFDPKKVEKKKKSSSTQAETSEVQA
ncbi:MAG: hypothetical protein ACRDBG_24350 [Waterburya sp.]